MDEFAKREESVDYSNDQNAEHALTRRSFVSAVGMLVALPTVAGGFLMPTWTDEAFAAEGDSAGYSIEDPVRSKIIIAKRNEFGIVVCDMTKNKKTPVANANVKLKSLQNNKEVSGKSDSSGKVLLDISSMAPLTKDEDGVEMYTFFGQLEISCEGYRSYRTGRISCTGGRGVMAPTRKLDGEQVYPQMVTFDDWDILYTGNAFAVTTGNDVKHTIKMELVAKINDSVRIRIIGKKDDGVVVATTTATPTNGIIKAEFSDYYLLSIHKAALPVGVAFSLVLNYGYHECTIPLALEAQEAPNKVTAPGTTKLTLKPFDPNGLKPSITLPSWIPVLGGQVVNVWTPELPASLWFDPFGFVKFVARTGELGYKYKDKNGKEEENAWKYHPRKTSEEQWNEVNKARSAILSKYGKAVRGKTGLAQSLSYTNTLTFTAMLQIALAGKWRNDEALWRAGISAQAVLSFNFSYSQQFMLGPVPFVFDFGMNTSLTVAVSAALAATDLSDISKYTWDYGNSGVSFTVVVAPSISVGIGLKGLLTVSVQGQLSFSFCVAVQTKPYDSGKQLSNPRIIMGLVAQINVVVQAFIFTKSFELVQVGDPSLYDNWNGKVPGNTPPSLSAQAEEVDYFGDGMTIVEDEWLAEVSEFDGDGYEASDLSAQSDDAPVLKATVKEMQTLDGITYHCTVYEIERPSEEAIPFVVSEGDDNTNLVAAASPALTAQALQAQDVEPLLPKEAEYKASDSGKYQAFVEERSEKRFRGIASQSGLVPANDVCVAKEVFSDPRIKGIRIGDKTHVFRIATAKVEGNSRTRVVGQVLSDKGNPVGNMNVYDFNPIIPKDIISIFSGLGINRNEMYDYDFDVVFTPMKQVSVVDNIIDMLSGKQIMGLLTFFVISGKRGSGNATKFGQVACDLVFSLVRYLVYDNGETRYIGATGSLTSDAAYDAAGGGTEYKYHSFSCPQIVSLGVNDTAGAAGWMLTYLDRAGRTADDAVSVEAGKAKVGMGVCFTDSNGVIIPAKTNEILSKVKPITDGSIYEMTCSGRFAAGSDGSSAWHLVMMRGRNEALYYLLNVHTNPLGFKDSTILGIKAIVAQKGKTTEPMRLVEWPGHPGEFLTSKDGKLQKVTIGGLGNASPTMNFKDCGLTSFNVNSFGVDPTGSVIFWPSCGEDNAGYSYDNGGTGKKRKWTEVHQIMGSRLRNGTFSEPFVYGEVKHDMHVMHVLDYLNASSLTVLSVDLKEALKGKADLWFTSIPLVKCANVIGCEAASTFAYPGEKAMFYLTVRNDGNTYLSGFTAHLSEQGKANVSSAKLVFSQGTLCESGYNPADGGKLKNTEPDYALAPGQTSVYQVEILIPKDWKDEKKVNVSASEAVVAGSVSASAQGALSAQSELEAFADDDVEEYVVGTGDDGKYDYDEELDYGEGQEPFDFLNIWYDDEYDNEDEEEYKDAPHTDVPLTGGDSDKKNGETGKQTKTTPKTGDRVGGLSTAALALAAASAGMAAYSKRRSDLERGQAE